MVLHYGGNCNGYTKNLVSRLQKRAARIVKGEFDYVNIRGTDLMNDLGWQSIDTRKKYFLSSLMYKTIHGQAPIWLSNNVLMANENHNRSTRYASNQNVVVPKPNYEIFRKSFQYQGSMVWNGLPPQLKEANNLNSFKYLYKKLLF